MLGGYSAQSQCLTNSLIINTGYDPLTGLAIPGGPDGTTPVPDPHWIVTYEDPSIATAIMSTGLIEVVPGSNAFIITTLPGWISNPIPNPGGWLSCINSTTYTTDGTGPSGTPYNVLFARSFRMCSGDNITFDFYIANDNYIDAIDVDGVLLTFAQPAAPIPGHFTAFTHFTQTLPLAAGTHTITVSSHNYNETSAVPNPTGINIYGTVSSATATNSLVSESFGGCASFVCASTCNSISLPDTLMPCIGSVITLPATLTGTNPVLDITWSPIAGLSSSTVLTPTLTVGPVSGYYNIDVRSLITFNLVYNGDFSLGNTGFSSSYTYAAPPSPVLLEGDYSVYTDPFGVHGGFTSMADHTTGAGDMMIINGGPIASDIWCQTIPVTPNTDYDFSAWIANCSSITVGADVPILQFKINGILIGVPTAITSVPGVWTNFFTTWNSGINTTATICINDQNTTSAGNDFAIDDISFQEICTVRDSVYIDVQQPDTTFFRHDTTMCIALAPLTLPAPTGYATYAWSTGATTPAIFVSASGTYIAYSINGCTVRVDTFAVNFIPLPVPALGNDTGFCTGNTLVLSSVQPSGTSYLWSTGSTGDSIHVSVSGMYWLRLNNGCIVTDTIRIAVSPYPVVDLGPDTGNCNGALISLQSSVVYTSPTYLWNTGSGASSIVVGASGTYWLQVTVGGCPGSDTINVRIVVDTMTLYNNDTAICRGQSIKGMSTGSPGMSYLWLPTAGIGLPTYPNPLITPDTSAMYYLIGRYPGCPDLVDSFYIDVQPNPIVYAGGNRAVCEFDTLHLHAMADPRWYTHYNYSWSPGISIDDSLKRDVVFTAGDSTHIILTVSTPAGCIGQDSALLIVHPGNFVIFDSLYNICPRDSVQFQPEGGFAYAWHPGIYLSDSTIAEPWVHAITTQRYTLIASSDYGCKDTLSTIVVVRPGGVVYLGDSVTIYPGESYQISPQTNCVNFTWFPPSGLDNPYISNPVATPVVNTKYKVEAMNEWGCRASDSISIYFEPSAVLALPNAFTPGSGVNNKFYVLKRGIATLKYFRVYNRWGNMVFETTNIDEGWDGTFNNKPQPFGVYVYVIEAETNDGTIFEKHGNVTLIR